MAVILPRPRAALVWRVLRPVFVFTGAASLLVAVWLWNGWPIVIDRWLDVSEPPVQAAAIICLGGGSSSMNLPTEEGWRRIYTAVQLYADGYAPTVVFSGGGAGRMSEAEVYRDAAVWLGLPEAAARLDPRPATTADHPQTLLGMREGAIARQDRLLVVTSRLHSRRVLRTFMKQGFTNVRVVAAHRAANRSTPLARHGRTSAIEGYVPSGRRYNDPLRLLSNRADVLTGALREVAALGWYWWRGLV